MTFLNKVQWKNIVSIILNYIFLVALVFIILFFTTNIIKYYHLKQNSIKVTGEISKMFCDHHQEFEYKFKINGNFFSGVGKTDANTLCETLHVGDKLDVFYFSDDPNVNINDNPELAFENELIFVAFGAIFAPVLILFFYKTSI